MNIAFSIPKALLGIVAVVILFITITLVINLSVFDEEPSPAVVKIMQPNPISITPDNLYFSMLGISAAADENIAEAGMRLIERYRINRDENGLDTITQEDYVEILGSDSFDKEWQEQYPICASRREQDCLAQLSDQIKNSPVEDKRLLLMLKRFDRLVNMPNFKDIGDMSVGTPIPPFATLRRLSRIKLVSLYNQGDSLEFLNQIEIDIQFWKKILIDGNMLMTKMVAVALIWDDLQYLSEFMLEHEVTREEQTIIASLLSPLTVQELDISESFIFEVRSWYPQLSNIKAEDLEFAFGSSAGAMSLLIQPNATNNKHYRLFIKPIIHLSKLPMKDFYEAVKTKPYNYNKNLQFNFSLSSLYNLGGKLLLPLSIWEPSDYIARVHDLNGMINLVKLQLTLKSVDTRSVEAAIENSDLTNPYTDKPMNYDKENNWLGFECLDKSSVCQIKIWI